MSARVTTKPAPISFTTLSSVDLVGTEPPTEFRIFTAGQVDTKKGEFTFDLAAAESVMAEYEKHGIDLPIDYDHASLSSLSLDPAQSGKAAGWFNLELRAGELWATNVRWTEPAAAQLRAKEWRFISPAFSVNDGRVSALLNVAITNLPATRNLEPLMAASTKDIATLASDTGLSPKLVSAALEAVASKDAKGGLGVLQQILAALLGGSDPDASTEDAAPPAGDGGADEATEPVAAGGAPAKKDDADVAASVAKFMRLSGKTDILAALAEAETWRTSHLTLETERQVLASERLVLEAAERRKGCVELVTLAGRAPATVWANDAATEPKSYLSSMPLKDFRVMVADAIKANGGKPRDGVQPGAEVVAANGLTPSELAACKRSGCTPEAFLALKSQRDTVTA